MLPLPSELISIIYKYIHTYFYRILRDQYKATYKFINTYKDAYDQYMALNLDDRGFRLDSFKETSIGCCVVGHYFRSLESVATDMFDEVYWTSSNHKYITKLTDTVPINTAMYGVSVEPLVGYPELPQRYRYTNGGRFCEMKFVPFETIKSSS